MNKPDTTVDELIAQGEKRAELLRQETYTNAASIMYDLCAALQSLQGELAEAVEVLEKLARLGNGDHYGNSDGNRIAQAFLKKRGK